jgi:hypothetical protein
MSAGRRSVLLVMALVGGVAAAPGHADTPPSPVLSHVVDAGLLPSGSVAVVDGRVTSTRTVAEALTSTRRHADAGAWVRSVAAATALTQGDATGRAPIVYAEDPAEPEPGEDVDVEPFAAAGAGGDLDGDGLEDVLSFVADETSARLQARRGRDGAPLWSADLEDTLAAFAYPTGRDLTGDGVDDLLVEGLTSSAPEPAELTLDPLTETYSYGFTADVTWLFGVVSGVDGSPVWTRTVPGTIDESFSYRGGPGGVVYEFDYTLRSTALAVVPALSDDLTGDGLADLAVSTISVDVDDHATGASALVAGAVRATATLRGSTLGEVVEGTTGRTAVERSATEQPGVSVLVPVGQVVGSPVADLAWTTYGIPDFDGVCAGALVAGDCVSMEDSAPSVSVELLDGATATSVWERTTPGFDAFVRPTRTDVDGDGSSDLAVEVFDTHPRLEVVSGADGAQLWRADGTEFPPLLLGVDDTASGRLAVVADVAFNSDEDAVFGTAAGRIEAIIERRAASAGDVLSTTRHAASAEVPTDDGGLGFTGVAILATGEDGDGDDVGELVVSVAIEATSFDTDGDVTSSSAQSAAVVESFDGARRALTESSDDVRFLLPLGDLDGDGLLDLQRDVLVGDDGFAFTADTTAFRLVDGEELWRLEGSLFDVPLPAGDQDGSPGAELLQVRYGDGPPEVLSLRGQDLTVRWSAPA